MSDNAGPSLQFHAPRIRNRSAAVQRLCLVGCVAACGISLACTQADSTHTTPAAARPIKRVIAVAPNAAEIICGLGACDLLVGVGRFCTEPPRLASVPKVGGLRDPDLEAVVSLKPDLIVMRGRSDPLQRLCEQNGIRTYEDRVESLDDVYRTIQELASILGRDDEGVRMIAEIRAELASVAARAADRSRPKVLVTLRSPARLANILTCGPGSFVSDLIEIAGGENLFSDRRSRYPAVTVEEIITRRPDVIIEAMAGEDMDDPRRQVLLDQWRDLGPLPAVDGNRVHFVTEPYLTVPSQRVVAAARLLQKLIHPEIDRSG